jgi:uncharacterized membrane protein YphA (DoxX/SURF4 family)
MMKNHDRRGRRVPRWRVVAAWAGGAILGLVLLTAAWGKALDPLAFAEQISFEGLDFAVPAEALAWLVVVAEVVLGFALVLGLRTRAVLLPTGALIAAFVFLTGRAYIRWLSGVELEGPNCGCFGNLVSRTPAQAFWQDLLLLVPPYVMCWLWTVRFGSGRLLGRWGLVLAAGAGAGAVTALAPGLPLDDLATRLAPGVEVTELCAGSTRDASQRICLDLLVPELEKGRHLVVVDDLDSEVLRSKTATLNNLVGVDGTRVWVIDDATEEARQLFFWELGPLFEVREAPTSLLRPLYRTKPRSFLVVDGRVERTWSGLPEFERVDERL